MSVNDERSGRPVTSEMPENLGEYQELGRKKPLCIEYYLLD